MAKIYVASSWRNQYYSDVVDRLREAGHEVYDFRNPPQGTGGFHWSDVDPNYIDWSVDQYREGMKSPRAKQQFVFAYSVKCHENLSNNSLHSSIVGILQLSPSI